MSTALQKSERLNWKQACELLGCKKTKFYLLIKNNTLRAYKTGKRGLWVRREDCEKLLQSSLPAL